MLLSPFLPSKPVFTPSQIERMANILDNAGQGFFVVLVLTPLVEGIDKTNPWMLILGVFYMGFVGQRVSF